MTMLRHRAGAVQGAFTIWAYHALMIAGSIHRFNSDLGLLEQSVSRAGEALGCCFSDAEEYEAAVISARRAAGAFDRRYVKRFQWVIAATVVMSLAALIAIFL
jgi:hypothetical protein